MLDDIRAGCDRCRRRLAPRPAPPPPAASSRSSSRSATPPGCRRSPRSPGTPTSRPTTGASWRVSWAPWPARRATTRAAGSRRKHLEIAQAGQPTGGGTRPFGYRDDFRTIEPTEAAAIREAVARVLAGDSLRSVATDWNARGHRSVRGRHLVDPGPAPDARLGPPLGPALLPRRDRRHRVIGSRSSPPSETARLRALLNDPARLTRRTVRRYLLSGGLLRCGLCDAVLVARPRERRHPPLRLRQGSGPARLRRDRDPRRAARGPHRRGRPVPPRHPRARRRPRRGRPDADDDRRRRPTSPAIRPSSKSSPAPTASGQSPSASTWPPARRSRPASSAARRTPRRPDRGPTALERYVGDAGALRAAWSDLPLTRQRAIVAAVLDRAVVGGRPRSHPLRP